MSEFFCESSICFEDSNDNDNDFEVECVLDRRTTNGQMEYLLKWKNFDESHNSWETLDKMDCSSLIMDFERKKKKHMKTSSKSKKVPRSKRRRMNSGQSDDVPVVYRLADESGSLSETSLLNTSTMSSQPSVSQATIAISGGFFSIVFSFHLFYFNLHSQSFKSNYFTPFDFFIINQIQTHQFLFVFCSK